MVSKNQKSVSHISVVCSGKDTDIYWAKLLYRNTQKKKNNNNKKGTICLTYCKTESLLRTRIYWVVISGLSSYLITFKSKKHNKL